MDQQRGTCRTRVLPKREDSRRMRPKAAAPLQQLDHPTTHLSLPSASTHAETCQPVRQLLGIWPALGDRSTAHRSACRRLANCNWGNWGTWGPPLLVSPTGKVVGQPLDYGWG